MPIVLIFGLNDFYVNVNLKIPVISAGLL
ncbi:hypothetical protein AGR13a_Cc60041 [Agrobacterium genomosp. 13 str. CFBP 6927]|uniref:Uncharacterized protein n=1 Tax=Agrobacterium genomosp. 13 str. CFBP 6927 TaxID=1183428 RepID=A0ABP2BJ31_9HYPH|nr:hypothetical protein AGR13a_Cc60041 [Agrobacterium genomosp. 13 str. CFBP 6927]